MGSLASAALTNSNLERARLDPGVNASAHTSRLVSPALRGLQLTPLLWVTNTPPPTVPAYTVLGIVVSIANAPMAVVVRPLFTGPQATPSLMLLNTPLMVPA